MGSSYQFGIYDGEKAIGSLQVRADVPFGEKEPLGWSSRFQGLEHKSDVSAELLREKLPASTAIKWDDKVYGGAENAELRGRGDGLKFWISISCGRFPDGPTEVEKETARPRLEQLRNLLWAA